MGETVIVNFWQRKGPKFVLFLCFCSAINYGITLFQLFSTAYAKLASEGSIVGVEVGDWAKYDIQGETGPLTEEDWARIEVIDVSGTNLTVRILGGEYPQNDTVVGDVTEGLRGDVGILGTDVPFILPRDFNISSINETFVNSIGFPLPLSYNFTWNVETLERKYGEASREVNLINVVYRQSVDVHVWEWHNEFCWDKATGVVLEASYTYYVTNGSYAWGHILLNQCGFQRQACFRLHNLFPLG